ncbi:hypothetical protein HK405_011991 [Cladochytrium tenue]|nr:hypothetical protein HK405_011991 [Cladochytrium tenue]
MAPSDNTAGAAAPATAAPAPSLAASPRVVISGGGVAGLLLAVALKRLLGLNPVVYEQASGYADDVGGAIGLYPNGLRVIRDVAPDLFHAIRNVAYPYLYRRWLRADGSEVAVAEERFICEWDSPEDERDLSSVGIRRWRLQRALADACEKEGISIKFGTRVVSVAGQDPTTGVVSLELSTGETVDADLVFGCDGVKSVLRGSLFPASEPEYTGVTVLMGVADIPREKRGICFPSSATSGFHACYYPTGPEEQIFQIFFPTPERPESWKALTAEEGREECYALAEKMKTDGWDAQFVNPLLEAKTVLRTGLRARLPIPLWHRGRIVLLGDAAHPPVPYIGQGAMMAIEDVGILVTVLRALCIADVGGAAKTFCFDHAETAFRIYEDLRVPRTTTMVQNSMSLGKLISQPLSPPPNSES